MDFPRLVGEEILKRKIKTKEEAIRLRDKLAKEHKP